MRDPAYAAMLMHTALGSKGRPRAAGMREKGVTDSSRSGWVASGPEDPAPTLNTVTVTPAIGAPNSSLHGVQCRGRREVWVRRGGGKV